MCLRAWTCVSTHAKANRPAVFRTDSSKGAVFSPLLTQRQGSLWTHKDVGCGGRVRRGVKSERERSFDIFSVTLWRRCERAVLCRFPLRKAPPPTCCPKRQLLRMLAVLRKLGDAWSDFCMIIEKGFTKVAKLAAR